MYYFLIILLIIVALVGVSLALGRTTREAQSVRDDEFVELEGAWIRYRVAGEGPPVLLVHGFPTSSRIWESLAGRLSERFTVYTLDLRGFGESDKPLTGYGIRHGSRLLYSFCSHFGIGEVAVVGHDLGGDMAVKLAADHPELVRSVTAVAAPANEEQIDPPNLLWMATLPVVGPLFYALGQYAGFVRVRWMRPFVSDRYDLPEGLIEDAAASTPAAVRSTFNTARREVSRERIARQSRQLKVPMLVIHGEEDQIVDPGAAEVWSRNASQSEVATLERCGHLPMIERPEEFGTRLLAFLTGDERYLFELGYKLASEETPVGEPQPAEPRPTERAPEEPAGVDGLEPDDEASAAEPHAEAPRERLRGRETGDYRGNGRTRAGRDEDLIPELPDDLFRWSGVRGGRHDERRRGGENGSGEHAEEPDASSGEELRDDRGNGS